MKKTFILLIVSIFLFTGCNWFAQPQLEPQTKVILDEVQEVADSLVDLNEEELDTTEPEIIPYGLGGVHEFYAELADVSGGGAVGLAGAVFNDQGYDLYANFENLPTLEDDFFYEGWVVRSSPLSVISTGEIVNNVNIFSVEDDLIDHKLYVLTLEPNDGDPAPAVHILEGTFK